MDVSRTMFLSGGFRGEHISLFFPVYGGCLLSSAHGLFSPIFKASNIRQNPFHTVILCISLSIPASTFKDACVYSRSMRIIQDNLLVLMVAH